MKNAFNNNNFTKGSIKYKCIHDVYAYIYYIGHFLHNLIGIGSVVLGN